MLIYLGKRRQEKAMGYVVDFCPICRELTEFKLSKINDPDLSYGIPLATGATVGYLRECVDCQTFMHADPIRYAAFANRSRTAAIKTLAEATFPRAYKYHGKRLQLEKLIRQSPHTIEEKLRVELVAESFETLAPIVERRMSHFYLDTQMLIVAVLGLLAIFVLPSYLGLLSSSLAENQSTVSLVLALIFSAILGWQWKTAPRRYIRNAIYPRIAKALKILEPSEDELSFALGIAKRDGKHIGKLARMDELMHLFH
ncbi:hypothetical protein H8K35_03920 [Undibacterium sp. LX40W]|uniref:Uncharacterized protein n=1 Tax=Undibacterium nitidum TaxID=2762298 RepID=A0A923HSS3_9BURK|nr:MULTISPECIES: hypothetical protein [Undibacterium]MBC3880464.1 hypothetical protein [Undibacterium nitidum]MBC3890800.1 hypothetical protein [Undibacterium sp. LX40W]